ncbi:MAG: sensor histidine kinase [Minwuia sp.]|uniref:sensor histidine kinase n=1 Tax=Minwuia sp. TaxID=2493630 RepID=UPI003A838F5E
MNRWGGEFADPAMESRFRGWRYDAALPQFRIVGWLMVLAAIPYLWTTWRIHGPTETFAWVAAMRLVQVVITLWLLDAVRRRAPFAELNRAVFAGAGSMLAVNAVNLIVSDATSSLMIVQSLMIVTVAYVLYPGRLVPISLVLVAFSAMFAVMLFVHFDLTRIERPGMVIWTVLANFIGYLAARQLNLFRRMEFEAFVRSGEQLEALAKAHEEASRAREEAEAANRAKTVMLANTSHELRTPLNAILGFSEMISREKLGPLPDPRYVQYAADIYGSGRHLLSLIDDLLDLSKIEAGKAELHLEWLHIEDIFDAVRRMALGRADENGQTIHVSCDPALDSIHADERALRQILLNLLTNAIKFSPRDTRIELEASPLPGGGAVLAVHDRGPGIDPADVPRLLQPFQQARRAGSRKVEGWGLGLALVAALTGLHGAELKIDPREGGGTSVRVLFGPDDVTAAAVPDPMRAA